ncbi:MAG: C39 family peptidase [Ruminococcus sp.]|nr:C39 family peptidase [Ruminococcus sp.]
MIVKYKKRILLMAIMLLTVLLISMMITSCQKDEEKTDVSQSGLFKTEATIPVSYMIEGVPVIKQGGELSAACETYACTMLLQSLGIDMNEYEFVNSYLNVQPIYGYSEDDWYGPDLDSAYAGDVEWGYGINSPGMAKCMNNMLGDKGSEMTATSLKGVELDELCKDYIINDIPVMVWATTNMEEPYIKRYWTINYVDEEVSDAQIGDTEQWMQNEHCMVLIGYDESNYYFADSVAGEVSVFDKETSRDKYEKLGLQAIVVK